MDEKRTKRKEEIDSKLDELYTEKCILQNKLRKVDSQIMPLVEERHKIIKFDSWMHNYSDTILVQKMDRYDDIARYYWSIMECYKSNGFPKWSSYYQIAKCNYRIAIVNLESIIDKINWIDSKYYRKEF